MNFRVYLPLLALLPAISILCQDFELPESPSVASSKSLSTRYENKLEKDKKDLKASRNRKDIIDIYERRTQEMLRKIENSHFLDSDLIQDYVNGIQSEILEQNPHVSGPELLLIARDPSPNAYCTGEGTIVLNLGLLLRTKSSDEIAFVLAHEIAHWHLDHVNKAIKRTLSDFSVKELRKSGQLKKLSSGDLEILSSLFYTSFEHSRENEIAADSMAFQMLKPTPFSIASFRPVLAMLDSANQSPIKSSAQLNRILYYDNYPFKHKWLAMDDKPRISNSDAPSFIFASDSVNSHPNNSIRLAALDSMLNLELEYPTTVLANPSSLDSRINEFVDLEMISSSFVVKNYAFCLFYLLEKLNQHPENESLNLKLTSLFIELHEARRKHVFGKHVPIFIEPDHWLSESVVFLNNVRMSEYAKLAYWQFQERVEFNPDNIEHYKIKWKTLHSTKRIDEALMLKKKYDVKFPTGNPIDID